MRRKITEEDIKNMLNLKYYEKYTNVDIAKKLKISTATVQRYVNKYSFNNNGDGYSNDIISNGIQKETITTYIPHYRREIKPQVNQCTYTYGDISFIVDYDNGTLRLVSFAQDQDQNYNDYILPLEYTKSDLDELINIGEALVGIGMTYKNKL